LELCLGEWQMKKLITLCVLSGILIGCSISGPEVAKNGKTYYMDSDRCARYQWWPNKDYIECFNSDGKSTGYLWPMSQKAVDDYNRQVAVSAAQSREAFQSFNDTVQRISDSQTQQMQQRQRIYQENQRILQDMNNSRFPLVLK
jgi:hypothetical protein